MKRMMDRLTNKNVRDIKKILTSKNLSAVETIEKVLPPADYAPNFQTSQTLPADNTLCI